MRSLFLALIASGSLTGLCAAATDDIFAANKKLGREINLGNALEAPKEGEWGVTLNARNADLVEGLPPDQGQPDQYYLRSSQSFMRSGNMRHLSSPGDLGTALLTRC